MNKFISKKITTLGVLVIVLVLIASGSYYAGYIKGVLTPKTILVQGVDNMNKGKQTNTDFALFWEAWNLLKEKDINASSTSDQDLLYGAITGLFGSFKDPNTNFFPPIEAEKFKQDISGSFSGIGAEIGIKNQQLVVIAPLKSSPAEHAGIKSGDAIVKINSQDTYNMTVDQAVKLIRGEKGSTVILTILRNGWRNPKDFPIIRDIIQVPTLDWEMKPGGIAYIHLYNFYEQAPYLFYQAAIKTAASNPKGIILDLRDNPGGYLETAVSLAGWFLKSGDVVVSEQFKDSNQNQTFKALGSGYLKDLPIVILVNGGSASASEILAGALHDNRGVKLVGVKTFGKGTVQELDELSNGSLAKITIAHWVRPNGQIIDKNGIAPDYNVEISDADATAGKDPQLDKALEVLRNEISQNKSDTNLIPLLNIQSQ